MALTKHSATPTTSPTSLVARTAHAIYMAEHAGQAHVVAYEALPPAAHARYERMASAALTEAFREPVTV